MYFGGRSPCNTRNDSKRKNVIRKRTEGSAFLRDAHRPPASLLQSHSPIYSINRSLNRVAQSHNDPMGHWILSASSTAAKNALSFAGSFFPGEDSTPLATSTA